LAGHRAHEAELVAHQAVELADLTTWELWREPSPKVQPREDGAADAPGLVAAGAAEWTAAPSSVRDLGARWGVHLAAVDVELADAIEMGRPPDG
jgi:hypothetical protein